MEPPPPDPGTDDAVRRWASRSVIWVLAAALAGVAWVTTWDAVELSVAARAEPADVRQDQTIANLPAPAAPLAAAQVPPTPATPATPTPTPTPTPTRTPTPTPTPSPTPAVEPASPPPAPLTRAKPLSPAAAARAALKREQQAARELAALARTLPASLALWTNPLAPGYRITALFGASGSLWSRDHTGLDLAVPTGTPVHATAAGVVATAGDAGAYGQRVTITHDDGTETWYAHLSRIDVEPGQSLSSGDVIGAVGATGNVTGPHLHLEVRPAGGDPVDPVDALDDHGVDVRS